MAKANTGWQVLPHDPIDKLAPDVWRVQGELANMPLLRVMTIARMSDGRLVIHNGIALEDAAMSEIEAFGEPAFLIVPNGYHRLDAPAYRERYPNIQVLCPSGARKKVAQVVPVSGSYRDFPADAKVELREVDGVGQAEGVMLVHSDDGTTLVINDLVFNMPHVPGFTGFIFRHLTQSSGGPRVTRIVRWFIMKDRRAVRAELERLADIPDLRRIIVSHHLVIDDQPAEVLRRVARTL